MANEAPTIALADLATGRVGTVEAVTIVREIANRIAEGSLPGVPSPQVIRLTAFGSIAVEGPIAADARTVAHAAYLLETLLPTADLRHRSRVPGALQLIVARAMGTLDLPPYPTLGAFADALARFAAPDATLCIQALVLSRTLDRPIADPLPLAVNGIDTDGVTISDIRRARRATGLTLTDVSDRTGIPAPLLCELEWGYLRHWPAPAAARQLLVRYARATGLDDELVLRTVWPILEEQVRDGDRSADDTTIIDAVPVDESDELVPVVEIAPVVAHYPARKTGKPRRRAMVVAAFAIPALLVIGIAPSARSYLSARRHATDVLSTTDTTRADAAPSPAAGSTHEPLPTSLESDSTAVERVAVTEPLPDPSAFTSVGSAIFQSPTAAASRRADVSDQSAVLRITRVTDDGARNFHARLSPDGRQIAFDSDRDGLRGVYVAERNGEHVRRVSGEGFAAIPTWSPRGQHLAFVRAESDRPDVWNLWTVTVAGGQERRITAYRAGQVWGASWFPDGKRIAFSHQGRAMVMNLSNGVTRTYPSPRKGPIAGIPAVSPDGARALFRVTGDGTWLLEFKTGMMQKIVSDPSAEDYTWSPDGRRVAYHSRATDTWGVWIMPASAR